VNCPCCCGNGQRSSPTLRRFRPRGAGRALRSLHPRARHRWRSTPARCARCRSSRTGRTTRSSNSRPSRGVRRAACSARPRLRGSMDDGFSPPRENSYARSPQAALLDRRSTLRTAPASPSRGGPGGPETH
jgi:hypothetical protein